MSGNWFEVLASFTVVTQPSETLNRSEGVGYPINSDKMTGSLSVILTSPKTSPM